MGNGHDLYQWKALELIVLAEINVDIYISEQLSWIRDQLDSQNDLH